MNRSASFVLVASLFLLHGEVRAENANRSGGLEIANKLSDTLIALGSFEAEYLVVSPNKPPTHAAILINNELKYSMISLTSADKALPSEYFVLDLAGMDEQSGFFEMLTIHGDKGLRYEVSFSRYTPAVGACFIVWNQLSRTNRLELDSAPFANASPYVHFGLEETNLSAGLTGIPERKKLEVSWLNASSVTNASSIVESPDSVQLVYKEGHTVTVDRSTGLLLKEFWPGPHGSGQREITLKSHSPIRQSRSYASIIPNFERIDFGPQAPTNKVFQKFKYSALTELGRRLAEVDDLEAMLQRYSAEDAKKLRTFMQQLFHSKAESMVTKEAALRFREKMLIPFYNDYLVKHPDEAKDMTLLRCVEKLKKTIEADPNFMRAPAKFVDSVQREFITDISMLPYDAQGPLKKVYAVAAPVVCQAMFMETMFVTLEKVKGIEQAAEKE
jgi:hypothetical protein